MSWRKWKSLAEEVKKENVLRGRRLRVETLNNPNFWEGVWLGGVIAEKTG